MVQPLVKAHTVLLGLSRHRLIIKKHLIQGLLILETGDGKECLKVRVELNGVWADFRVPQLFLSLLSRP